MLDRPKHRTRHRRSQPQMVSKVLPLDSQVLHCRSKLSWRQSNVGGNIFVFLHRRELHQHGFVAACCLNTFKLAKPIAQNTQYWNANIINCGFYDKCKMQTGEWSRKMLPVFCISPDTVSHLSVHELSQRKIFIIGRFEHMCTTCLLIQFVHH